MNTPTPAQALGEAPALKPQMPDTWSRSEIALGSCPDGSFVQYSQHRAIIEDLRRQHGQHFAGLEARAESLARSLQMSEELRATSEGNLIRAAERAEAAEARCAELERLSAAISRDCNDCANQRNAANARVREAEGLLRHWQAWICGPSELHKATATFIAANGETK